MSKNSSVNHEIILNSGGVAYKHTKAARPGDLWITLYHRPKYIVAITENNGGYITYQGCNPDQPEVQIHGSSFYSGFERIDENTKNLEWLEK